LDALKQDFQDRSHQFDLEIPSSRPAEVKVHTDLLRKATTKRKDMQDGTAKVVHNRKGAVIHLPTIVRREPDNSSFVAEHENEASVSDGLEILYPTVYKG
jgi:hypothetical protein